MKPKFVDGQCYCPARVKIKEDGTCSLCGGIVNPEENREKFECKKCGSVYWVQHIDGFVCPNCNHNQYLKGGGN